MERPTVTVVDNIVDKPVTLQRLVENPVVDVVDKIIEVPVEKIVYKIVEKPVIVQRIVERPVETIIETSEATRVVTHEVVVEVTDVKAKFIDTGIRETVFVERITGEHPEDAIVGDENPEFLRFMKEDGPRHTRPDDPKRPTR